jgi:hypothetical protein
MPKKSQERNKRKKPILKKTPTRSYSTKQIFEKFDDVIFRETHDGSVGVLRLSEADAYFKIENCAAQIWLLIDGKRTVSEIYDKVCAQSKRDLKEIESKGKKVFLDLAKMKLARLKSPSAH